MNHPKSIAEATSPADLIGAESSADNEVREVLRKMKIKEENLFDYTGDGDELYKDGLRPLLAEWEIDDAMKMKRFIRGVMLVLGDPGSGKGLFGNTVAWKIKRYFAGRKALLDYKPRPAFGLYLPFDEEFLHNELGKMAEFSKVKGELPNEIDRKDKKRIDTVKGVAEKWVTSKEAEVYLSNSVLVLEEFKRYMHNRRPMNPMGITIGHIITWWRHLDILILGMTPYKREIDAISCLPYVTHEVRCSWESSGTAGRYSIYQTQWVSSKGVLRVSARPFTMRIDGAMEREVLGNKCYFELYNSKFLPSIGPAGK